MLHKFIVCVQLFFQVSTLIYIHTYIHIYNRMVSCIFAFGTSLLVCNGHYLPAECDLSVFVYRTDVCCVDHMISM